MANALSAISGYPNVPRVDAVSTATRPDAVAAAPFQDLLLGMLRSTNDLQQQADAAIEESLIGGDISQIEVFASVKKADLALRMMLQVRNKLVEAYQEVQQLRM